MALFGTSGKDYCNQVHNQSIKEERHVGHIYDEILKDTKKLLSNEEELASFLKKITQLSLTGKRASEHLEEIKSKVFAAQKDYNLLIADIEDEIKERTAKQSKLIAKEAKKVGNDKIIDIASDDMKAIKKQVMRVVDELENLLKDLKKKRDTTWGFFEGLEKAVNKPDFTYADMFAKQIITKLESYKNDTGTIKNIAQEIRRIWLMNESEAKKILDIAV